MILGTTGRRTATGAKERFAQSQAGHSWHQKGAPHLWVGLAKIDSVEMDGEQIHAAHRYPHFKKTLPFYGARVTFFLKEK